MKYLTPCRDIDYNYINLLSGATTSPFLETIQELSEGDTSTIQRINDLFTILYSSGEETDMLEILHILYSVVGMEFPQEIENLSTHAEARSYFLLEILVNGTRVDPAFVLLRL